MQNGSYNLRKKTQMLVTLGILIAIEITLARFVSIRLWSNTYSFGFIAVAVAAYMYGPYGAMAVAGLGDLIGAILYPIAPYFAGFTITAVLTGLIWGLLMYHKQYKIWKVILAVVITQVVFSQIVNTFWIYLLYGSDRTYWFIFTARLWQTGLYIAVSPPMIFAMAKIQKSVNRD